MSTTTLTDEDPSIGSRIARVRRTFRAWRWQRPFWAGALTILGGLPIMYFPYANMQLGDLNIRISTTAGAGSLVIGVLMVTLGLTMWYQPITRIFAGVATLVLVLVSLVVSNFGGFLVGYLLGLFGGGMSISWMPGEPADEDETGTEPGTGAPAMATAETAETAETAGPADRAEGAAYTGSEADTTDEGEGQHRGA
jgi:hypothetical protein